MNEFQPWLIRLIPLLPAIGAVVLGLAWMFGSRFDKKTTSLISCAGPLLAFAISVLGFLALMDLRAPFDAANKPPPLGAISIVDSLWTWFSFGESFNVPFAFELDPLSSVMTLVVTGIGFLIHVYSTAYMGEDPGFQKFMSYLNLFTAAMLVLVLGNNFLVMFIGWEGVGLCSYLLIGFWYSEKANANAAMKAFVVNRIGDFAFIVGVGTLVWGVYHSAAYQALPQKFNPLVFAEMAKHWEVFTAVQANPAAAILGIPLITFATLCFFGGATGKSAQIPLFVWLPDAMAGPTPVSALIHAATMVTSGIYMIARLNFLYSLAPATLLVVAITGAATALIAASIGLFQYDIKKVLAYSTVSQLGYMFLGLGAAAYTAGMFHLFTHAFFKALLFLGSGSVIHALHHALPHGVDAQDMRNMGGLRKYMPVTFWTFFVGVWAIAGIPPFAGFWSKDEILWKTFERWYLGETYGGVYLALYGVGLIAAVMTAFYMTRQLLMTFYGEYRGKKAGEAYLAAHGSHHDDAHGDPAHGEMHDPEESPFAITFPLRTLAIGSMVVGFLGVAAWATAWFHAPNYWNTFLASTIVDTRSAPTAHASLLAANPTKQGDPHATDATHAATTDDPGGAHHAPPGLEFGFALISILVAIVGILYARYCYLQRPEIPARRLAAYGPGGALSGSFPGMLYRWIYNKYYVDEAYGVVFVGGTLKASRASGWVDSKLVDGFVNFLGYLTLVVRWIVGAFDKYIVDKLLIDWMVAGLVGKTGAIVRKMQTGDLQVYLRWVAYGTLATAGGYFLIILTAPQ